MADDVKLSSLRVSAQLDASAYKAGADQKVAADRAMVASGQQVNVTVSQTDVKISQAGDVIARLSRQYVDGYANAQRMASALNQLSSQIERGNTTAAQAGPILDGIARKYGEIGNAEIFAARGQREFADAIAAANARLAEQQATQQRAMQAANQNQGGLQRFGAINASAQLQDIAVTAAMGQSLTTIALQQGTQLGMAMENVVVAGTGAMGLVRGLGAAFQTMLTPVNMLSIGLTFAFAAAVKFFMSATEDAEDLNKVLTRQKDIIQSLGPAYEELARRQSAAAQAPGVGRITLQQNLEEARKISEAQAQDALKEMQGVGGAFLGGIRMLPESAQAALGRSQVAIEFDRIVEAGVKGQMTINEVRTALERFGQTNVDGPTQFLIDRFLEISEAAAASEREVGKLVGILDKMAEIRLPERGILPIGSAADLLRAEELIRMRRMRMESEAELASIGARSPAELAEAARRREMAAAPGEFEGVEERRLRAEIAATQARTEAEHELREAQEERQRSLDRTIESSRLDLELIGKTIGETERLRMETNLLADLREEAARNHVAMDEAEIARIKEKSAEYGRLAEQIARANLQQDLAFELRQTGRSDQDQRIAERLRGAGLPEDLQSSEANTMRQIEQIERIKDTWGELFDTVNDGVDTMVDALFEGTDDWEETLKKMGRDFARQMFDLALTNPLKNWLTGGNLNTVADLVAPGTPGFSSGRGGGFGGVLGNLFGAGKAMTAATMQVQAATVIVNGSVIPGAGGIPGVPGVPGSGGAGSGGISQATIQNRIDQAFGTTSQATIQNRIDQAFGGGGGMGGDLGKAASAIRSIESGSFGGNYNALGPLTGSGDRAYGAYQVMGANVPSWTKQALGQSMTPSQFLGNKQAQDAVFQKIFGGYMEKYGAEGAAQTWFTGSPTGGGRDVLGTSAGGYVGKFRKAFAGAPEGVGGVSQASEAIDGLTTSSVKAAESLSQTGVAGLSAVKGLTDAAGGLTQFGSIVSKFMAPGGGSGAGWFQNLSGMFGGAGGAINYMSAISPAATSNILAGIAGPYHEGGIAGYPSSYRHVDPRIFIGARRYHNGGLAGDEVPAILRKGEPVFRSMADARRMFAPANRNDAAKVNVNLKNINLFDPSVVGDYVRTDPGEQAMINMMRRTGQGRGL